MRSIQIIEVKSELGAGTRGASLGPDAIELFAIKKGDPLLQAYFKHVIGPTNDALSLPVDTPRAVRVKHILQVYQQLIDSFKDHADTQFSLVIAGDHSSAGGTISALRQRYPEARIGVVWIDAHADIHSPYTTPSGNMHGMPIAAVLDLDNLENQRNQDVTAEAKEGWEELKAIGGVKGKISTNDLIYVGVRDNEKEEEALIRQFHLKNYTVEEVREKGAATLGEEILQRFKEHDLIYVSFDVDSMDTSISVGTGTPVANGLWLHEAKDLIQTLVASPKCCCFELVEVNPLLDTENKMAEAAFEVIKTVCQSVESSAQ